MKKYYIETAENLYMLQDYCQANAFSQNQASIRCE